MATNYDGLTRNIWPGTWSTNTNAPIVLDTEIRGALQSISGDSGDRLTDIPGARIQEGMLVYLKTGYVAGATTRNSDSYYTYKLLGGESRSAITGAMPNAEANWTAYTTGGAGYTGSKGDLGYTGSVGVGYTGSQGTAGYSGSAGVGYTGSAGADALWNFTGAYSGGVSYAVGDVATYAGETWYRIHANGGNVGDTPAEGFIWTKIAEKGDLGYSGSAGVGYTGSSGAGFTGSIGYTGSGGELNITTSSTAPGSPNEGDIWIEESTGIQYFWVNDGNSYQWVEYANAGTLGYTGSRGYTGSSALGNNKKFSWSAPADGTPTSGGTTTGTIAGSNATFFNTTVGVRLTTTMSEDGRVVWNLTDIDFTKDLSLNISFYQSGADGISFGIGGTNAFVNYKPYTVTNNSLSFWYKTSAATTQFYKNGSAHGTETDYLTGLTYVGSWVSLKLVLQTISSTRYAFVYHQGVLINSLDITSWSPTGKYVFVGAWAGLVTGTHYVNSVSIDYI